MSRHASAPAHERTKLRASRCMHAHRPPLGLARCALHAPPAAAGSAPRDQTRLKMRYVIWIGQGGTRHNSLVSGFGASRAGSTLPSLRKSNREFIK